MSDTPHLVSIHIINASTTARIIKPFERHILTVNHRSIFSHIDKTVVLNYMDREFIGDPTPIEAVTELPPVLRRENPRF